MSVKAFVATSISMLLLYAPLATSAATGAAIGQLTTRGTAQINGMAVPAATTVFSGDRVTTEKNSQAMLTMGSGDQVLLPASSAASLERASSELKLKLALGSVEVVNKSATPIVVLASRTRIHPLAGEASTFEVGINGNALAVVARHGTAVVEAAGKTVEVKEGNELRATLAPNPPQAQAGGSSGLTSFQTFAIVVAAGGGVAGVALGASALSNQPPNPSNCIVLSDNTISCP